MTRQIQEIAVAVVTAVAGFVVDDPGFAGYFVVTAAVNFNDAGFADFAAVAGVVVDDDGYAGFAAVAGVVVVDDDGFVGVADIAADTVAAAVKGFAIVVVANPMLVLWHWFLCFDWCHLLLFLMLSPMNFVLMLMILVVLWKLLLLAQNKKTFQFSGQKL